MVWRNEEGQGLVQDAIVLLVAAAITLVVLIALSPLFTPLIEQLLNRLR